MQRRTVRRWSPRALMVALAGVATVATAVAVSRADLLPQKAVSVAMLSGGEGAALPVADLALPVPDPVNAEPAPVPESPPTTAAPTTTTARKSPPTTAGPTTTSGPKSAPAASAPSTTTAAHATAGTARATTPPCTRTGNSAPPCAPTCRLYDPATGASMPCPPPCYRYDTGSASGTASACPQPCPAYATADGRPAPCPPPPCAYPTEPVGNGTGGAQPQVMVSCPPPCPTAPGSPNSCPPPCSSVQPAPASTTADPVPPRSCPPPCQGPKACPPPCPSAAPSEPSCIPPCSYPGGEGSAAAAFAPCPASGVAGRVTAGPTCPVERPDEPCPDRPVETTLRLLRRDASVAATGKSGPDGSFRLAAAPGSYRLVADWPSPVGGCAPVEITVEQGAFTRADVSCDTGIR